jgi:hypothetical protein
VTIPESQKSAYEKRLCPDVTDEADDIYKIMNSYTNQTKRISFSINIFKCQVKKYINLNECASDDKIDLFLQNVYFTLYTLTNRVHYDDVEKPWRVSDKFHS